MGRIANALGDSRQKQGGAAEKSSGSLRKLNQIRS
jgi:hypothetical protein